MKILHVLTAPRAEGTPKLVLDWLSSGNDHLTHSVFFLNSKPDTLLRSFRQYCNEISFNDSPLKGINKFHKLIPNIQKACRTVKPDLVIAWPTGISQYIHVGARCGGVKYLITHAGNPPATRGILHRYIYSYMSFWPSFFLNVRVIACSEYVKTAFQKIPGVPKKIFFSVHNSFHPQKFLNVARKSNFLNAIMVATLEPHKDHASLIKAWKRVEERRKDISLSLAGDGSLKASLQLLCKNIGLKTVDFKGYVENVPDLLRQSSIFIFSTTPGEGFGTVLLEALAAGLQVIATDVPACREVLQDGKYGTLVRQKDSEALAEAILKAFETPLTDAQLTAQIAYASRFTPEDMMRQYLEIAGFKDEAKKLVDNIKNPFLTSARI